MKLHLIFEMSVIRQGRRERGRERERTDWLTEERANDGALATREMPQRGQETERLRLTPSAMIYECDSSVYNSPANKEREKE